MVHIGQGTERLQHGTQTWSLRLDGSDVRL